MSTTGALTNRVHYKDQLKLIRAETVVSWFAIGFDRAVKLLKIEPATITAREEAVKPPRHFGAFHC